MDIVFCTDNNYVMPCGIAITSLLENNKDEDITIHIIGLELTTEKKKILKDIKKDGNVFILIYDVKKDYLDQFDLPFHKDASTHITIAAYIRLFLVDILPKELDKVLYLDCDIIVVENISKLWNIDLNKYSAIGVVDHIAYEKETYTRLRYSEKDGYINSGVLLINLAYWRENNILNRFIDFINIRKNDILLHDQDVINAVLHDTINKCDPIFNLHSSFYYKKYRMNEHLTNLKELLLSPTIIHFSGTKPWFKDSFHPEKERYLYYKELSPWKKESLIWSKKTIKKRLRYYKRKFLYALHLNESKYFDI